MDEQERKAWNLLPRAERDRRLMDRLLKGDCLRVIMPEKLSRGEGVDGIPGGAWRRVSEWIASGYITGAVPVISPEGEAYFRGLKNLSRPIAHKALGEPTAHDPPSDCPHHCGRPMADHAGFECLIRETRIRTGIDS